MAKKPLADKLVVRTFDYDGFDPDLKGKLICLTGEINRAKTQHVKAALLMGEAIASANALLADHSKHGRFGEWVEHECGISKKTAYNYMWAWERFGSCSVVDQFDDWAMYALAAPSAPKTASVEAEKLAKKGIRITFERAKSILQSMLPSKPAADPKPDDSTRVSDTPPSAAPEKNHTESPTSSASSEADGQLTDKPDKSLEFDPEKLEKESRRRVGKPIIDRKVRTKAQKHLGDLIRILSEIGIYEDHEPALSAVAEHLTRV
jgi:hypothetical protein